ncbi:MAG: aldehyde ferredoxin oxidoreductase N-terminal domain-containing protein, partial [Elusimicrobiota bacterium]|nr:aldehyde ferredoxin oxidoreductase N-terminal domain-containing protein [Elusimicrobiota bacterium]
MHDKSSTFGYHGKLLVVDLTAKKISERTVDEETVKKYFLGSGLAIKILHQEFDSEVDPLSSENPIMFICGLFTGTSIPAACKLSVCAKSPLTGIWNEATVGGHWPAYLRSTGYDGIIIVGKSENPVYLYID